MSGGSKTRYGYEGKEFDSVVGDTDFNFRKYKADWGLFTQPDTVIQNVYDPQTLNRYSFERNNPYNRIDPNGHNAIIVVGILMLAFGILSAGYEAYVQYSITGRIYSWSRIGNSFLGGVWGGILEGAGVVAELSGSPVGAAIGIGIQAYGLYQINEQYLDAKKAAEEQKLKDKSDTDIIKESKPIPDITPITPNVQTDATKTVSANAQANAVTGNTNQNTYDSAYKYSKYSTSQPNKKAEISSTGTVTLGNGGSYGNFKCFISSCSATKAYKKSSK